MASRLTDSFLFPSLCIYVVLSEYPLHALTYAHTHTYTHAHARTRTHTTEGKVVKTWIWCVPSKFSVFNSNLWMPTSSVKSLKQIL